MTTRSQILRQHGIRSVELPGGIIIADTSKDENGTVHQVQNMTDKEFYQFLGY